MFWISPSEVWKWPVMLHNLVVLDRFVGMNDNYFHSKYAGCPRLLYRYTEIQVERQTVTL